MEPLFLLDSEQGDFGYLKLKSNQISCHESAQPAYLAWHSVYKRAPILEQNSALHSFLIPPIKLINIDNSHLSHRQFTFFQSFFTTQIQPPWNGTLNIPALVLTTPISNIEIEKQAWAELVRLILEHRLDPEIGLPSIRNTINSNMPERLIRQFFGSNKLTVQQLCQITGVTQRVYDFQHQKLQNRLSTKPSSRKFTAKEILRGTK